MTSRSFQTRTNSKLTSRGGFSCTLLRIECSKKMNISRLMNFKKSWMTKMSTSWNCKKNIRQVFFLSAFFPKKLIFFLLPCRWRFFFLLLFLYIFIIILNVDSDASGMPDYIIFWSMKPSNVYVNSLDSFCKSLKIYDFHSLITLKFYVHRNWKKHWLLQRISLLAKRGS